MLTFVIIISVHIMHIWITFLSAIGNLDTFAEGHRDNSKGIKENKEITKKCDYSLYTRRSVGRDSTVGIETR